MEHISLEALLHRQSSLRCLATIEAVDGDDLRVKVTPWSEAGGCSCRDSLLIPRAAITELLLTEHKHHCCGKVLSVVEVLFDPEATLSVQEAFLQRVKAAQSAKSEPSSAPLLDHIVYAAPGYGQGGPPPQGRIGDYIWCDNGWVRRDQCCNGQRCASPNRCVYCNGRYRCLAPGETCPPPPPPPPPPPICQWCRQYCR